MRGLCTVQNTPRSKPFPWPYPYSSQQGGVGGAGGRGMVSVPNPPYYEPFSGYWPHSEPRGLHTPSVRF